MINDLKLSWRRFQRKFPLKKGFRYVGSFEDRQIDTLEETA